MSVFRDWLIPVLESGRSEQAAPSRFTDADRAEAETVLREAFSRHACTVGGSRLAFDAAFAVDAARTLADCCWLLVSEDAETPVPKDRMKPPTTASAHLSADLVLRYLPAVYRRAKSVQVEDPLVGFCETIFRRFPLSGVLSGTTAGPESPDALDFHGHSGLRLLYAERLLECPHSAWVPTEGPTREVIEYVFDYHRKPIPTPLPKTGSTPEVLS